MAKTKNKIVENPGKDDIFWNRFISVIVDVHKDYKYKSLDQILSKPEKKQARLIDQQGESLNKALLELSIYKGFLDFYNDVIVIYSEIVSLQSSENLSFDDAREKLIDYYNKHSKDYELNLIIVQYCTSKKRTIDELFQEYYKLIDMKKSIYLEKME